MKILFVAMPDSVHTARWINQIADKGWDLSLFPVYGAKPHPSLRNMTLFGSALLRPSALHDSVRHKNWSSYYFYLDYIQSRIRHRPTLLKETALARAIQSIRPDFVHALEFQHSAYLTLGAKKLLPAPFPKWIATNWGSDIYLFGRLSEHREQVRAVLENCDFYSCECERDVVLAREYGLRGKVLPVFPNAGGFDLQECRSLQEPGNVSKRKLILLKGYQGWAGRALVGLRALARCAEILRKKGYSIALFSASPEVRIAAELFALETGVSAEIISQCSHTEMLKLYGRSRIYMGISISDAISTSLLEAMVMGAFPIQSCTACADEWIVDGQSGLIVPPEDVDLIETALRRALTDDALVDQAASRNAQVAESRLDEPIIRAKVIDFYEQVYHSLLERTL